MSETFNALLDYVLGALDLIYGNRWVAPFIVVPIMFLLAAWVRQRAINATNLYLNAARSRVDTLQEALGPDHDPVAERRSFADNFVRVSAAMYEDGPGAHNLVLAWRQFQEALVDENGNPVRNTARPSTFFSRMAPRQTDLTFASNIFVGAGLILTFLGLIVALNTAAHGMSGNDAELTKQSLEALLVVAGAKFFTSVAGLVASIWLRFTEHSLTRKVRHWTDLICDLLERGLLYVSPQGLAIEQLEVLREQRDQLRFFNTDVALQLSERIGEQFTQAIAPVTASINALNDNMVAVTQGVGAGAAEAIEKVSGEQLRGLSETLAGLNTQLTSIKEAVGQSNDEAANQIRLAGEDFAKAASDIREAFDQLALKVDGIGSKLAEQGEAASQAQIEVLENIAAGLTGAVSELGAASMRAANDIQNMVRESLEQGVRASQDTLRIAFEESSQTLRETTGSLSEAVSRAAQQVERAGEGFGRTGDKASETADTMKVMADNARTVASTLGDAAQGFADAASPVARAAQSVDHATQQLVQSITADREAGAQALSEMRTLAEGVRATQDAAEQAWRDYRGRFETVDRALEEITRKIADTLGDSMTVFREFAQQFDSEMGAAIGRLSTSLTQLEDYASSLDEYVEEIRGPREIDE